jgi:hypothetical protein
LSSASATAGPSMPLFATFATLAVRLALTLALLLARILIVLRVSAEATFTTPRLARAWVVLLRLIGSIIHSVIT